MANIMMKGDRYQDMRTYNPEMTAHPQWHDPLFHENKIPSTSSSASETMLSPQW